MLLGWERQGKGGGVGGMLEEVWGMGEVEEVGEERL